MVAYINFADPPSKRASDINKNFEELANGGVLQGAAVADATDETTVVTQFNELLAQLRVAGIIAA